MSVAAETMILGFTEVVEHQNLKHRNFAAGHLGMVVDRTTSQAHLFVDSSTSHGRLALRCHSTCYEDMRMCILCVLPMDCLSRGAGGTDKTSTG
jgi:hypothetical protein